MSKTSISLTSSSSSASVSGGCPSAQRPAKRKRQHPSQSERLNLILTDNGRRRKLNSVEACGRDVVSFCCFGGTFPGLSAIIIEYYWTRSPTSLHLLLHGIVGATQVDAALWESAVIWLALQAGGSTLILPSRLYTSSRSDTPNPELEHKQVNIVPIPYLDVWERVLKCIPYRSTGIFDKEYCSSIRLKSIWLAPVYGADGKFDSMMACDWFKRYSRCVVSITDFSGTSTHSTAIEISESSFFSEKPARVTRVSDWRVKGEMVFVVFERMRSRHEKNPTICNHGVLKIWDDRAGCKPKGYSDTYCSQETLFSHSFGFLRIASELLACYHQRFHNRPSAPDTPQKSRRVSVLVLSPRGDIEVFQGVTRFITVSESCTQCMGAATISTRAHITCIRMWINSLHIHIWGADGGKWLPCNEKLGRQCSSSQPREIW